MNTHEIPDAVYQDLRAHGEAAYPRECCGVLLGKPTTSGWRVMASARVENTHPGSPSTRYQIDPLELVRLQRQAHAQGIEIAGFYHSHPDHPPHWSPTDLEEAHWVGSLYVITEVIAGRAARTRAFLLAGTEEDKRFEPQTLRTVADQDSSMR